VEDSSAHFVSEHVNPGIVLLRQSE
jgi:hypothetical protein